MSKSFLYKCINCDREYKPDRVYYLCPHCSIDNSNPPKGVLKVIYPFKELIANRISFEALQESGYKVLSPIQDLKNLPNLKIGNTPLYNIKKLSESKLPFDLYLKDDSQNPTYSFKDRASAWVSAHAKETEHDTIITASTGNAGSSIAGICASQGQKAIVVVPASAPIAKLTQIIMYGATIVPVDGTYDDAFDLSVKATEEFGWYNRNTAFNPITVEGKKTVSFEIFDQLNKSIPDKIFVPVGDGVIISGVYKGFEDLLELGFIEKMPVIVAVQSAGSNNLVRNINSTHFEVKESKTIADSISVDYPRNFYMARDFIQKYDGEWISVSDTEIIEAGKNLAENTGLFAEPASATAFAGMLKYLELEKIPKHSQNVVLLTGSGLKDISALKDYLNVPKPIKPEISSFIKFIKTI